MGEEQEVYGGKLCLNILILRFVAISCISRRIVSLRHLHVHASDRRLTEAGSAKLFVRGNGDTEVKVRGILTDKELRIIRDFIKDNYKEMYIRWTEMSRKGFYEG